MFLGGRFIRLVVVWFFVDRAWVERGLEVVEFRNNRFVVKCLVNFGG